MLSATFTGTGEDVVPSLILETLRRQTGQPRKVI